MATSLHRLYQASLEVLIRTVPAPANQQLVTQMLMEVEYKFEFFLTVSQMILEVEYTQIPTEATVFGPVAQVI